PATAPATTLPLHDALPICGAVTTRPLPIDSTGAACQVEPHVPAACGSSDHLLRHARRGVHAVGGAGDAASGGRSGQRPVGVRNGDRKSTRLNSSHAWISYA